MASILVILIVEIMFEMLLEKINQTKLEPFEKLQAKTRYLNKKKVWRYTFLIVILLGIWFLSKRMGLSILAMSIMAGILISVLNTIFESTIYDQMRNTLR